MIVRSGPWSRQYGGHFEIDSKAFVTQCRTFPQLNSLKVGESIFLSITETNEWHRAQVRNFVRRINNSRAKHFICEWIDGRRILEIARIA